MEEKVKQWIKKEYKDVRLYHGNVSIVRNRCYGVLMFAINELFDEYNEQLVRWWDREMLPKFNAIDYSNY